MHTLTDISFFFKELFFWQLELNPNMYYTGEKIQCPLPFPVLSHPHQPCTFQGKQDMKVSSCGLFKSEAKLNQVRLIFKTLGPGPHLEKYQAFLLKKKKSDNAFPNNTSNLLNPESKDRLGGEGRFSSGDPESPKLPYQKSNCKEELYEN